MAVVQSVVCRDPILPSRVVVQVVIQVVVQVVVQFADHVMVRLGGTIRRYRSGGGPTGAFDLEARSSSRECDFSLLGTTSGGASVV